MKQVLEQKMNKKGAVNLEIAKGVMLILAVIVVLAFVIVILTYSMSTTDTGKRTVTPIPFANSSTTLAMNEIVNASNPSNFTTPNPQLESCAISSTGVIVINESNNFWIAPGNYTISGCNIYRVLAATPIGINNTYWKVSGQYTYSVPSTAANLGTNVSTGISSFFANTATWFGLLSVLIIIGIIGLVLYFVNRIKGSGGI